MNLMIQNILLVFLFSSISVHGFSQSHDKIDVDIVKRENKIAEIIQGLKSFQPSQNTDFIELKHFNQDNYIKTSIRLIDSGTLRLSNGEWIHFVSISSHYNKEVGDATLAIDNTGNIYINDGHVCGGIIHFENYNAKELQTSLQFFQNFVSDTDKKKWISLNHSKHK